MTPFPVGLFPVSGASLRAGGFVAAVLIGLALYAAAKSAQPAQQPPR